MEAVAVIDAGFGDAGKGLMTDYLSDDSTIVVRHNGGAQAGHTVMADGWRHVFSHFGSGSGRGAVTYLSEFFIVNPIIWTMEHKVLGWIPSTFIHPEAMVTTPYDMLINQELERVRSGNRYGSCGVGINETVTRCENKGFGLRVKDCLSVSQLRNRLEYIKKRYLPLRLAALGLTNFPHKLITAEIEDEFVDACTKFCDRSNLATNGIIDKFERVVFEGAQGLLLDEKHKFFPYVTRSRTGLDNVLEICSETKIDGLVVVYVTRSYMTRHGNGPFPTEDNKMSFQDDTNHKNEFQGKLRFGTLDWKLMKAAIDRDFAKAEKAKMAAVSRLAITHMDQFGHSELPHELTEYFGLGGCYVSRGPKRSDIEICSDLVDV